jgi:hypothetical protein
VHLHLLLAVCVFHRIERCKDGMVWTGRCVEEEVWNGRYGRGGMEEDAT